MDPSNYLTRDEFVAACGGIWQAVRSILAVEHLSAGAKLAALALLALDGPHRRRRPGYKSVAAAVMELGMPATVFDGEHEGMSYAEARMLSGMTKAQEDPARATE